MRRTEREWLSVPDRLEALARAAFRNRVDVSRAVRKVARAHVNGRDVRPCLRKVERLAYREMP